MYLFIYLFRKEKEISNVKWRQCQLALILHMHDMKREKVSLGELTIRILHDCSSYLRKKKGYGQTKEMEEKDELRDVAEFLNKDKALREKEIKVKKRKVWWGKYGGNSMHSLM